MSSRLPMPAELKSSLLIMCTDAPESTTHSLSSGFRVDGAGRHLFSEGEKNAVVFFSYHLKTFLASLQAASRAPYRVLKFWSVWGFADEDHLHKSFQAMDSGLEC